MPGNKNNKRPSGKKPAPRGKSAVKQQARNKMNKSNAGNHINKKYRGVIKNPSTKQITGRVYLKEENPPQKQSIWGLVVVILVLGLAAALIPFATGYIDLNKLSMKAAGLEWYYVGFSVLGLTVIGFALEEIYRERKS